MENSGIGVAGTGDVSQEVTRAEILEGVVGRGSYGAEWSRQRRGLEERPRGRWDKLFSEEQKATRR